MKLREVLLWILFAALVFAVWVFLAGRAEASVIHKKTLCHNGQTIEVALPAFFYHLQQHEGDYAGECEEPVVDVCENLEGVQETTPEGYVNDKGTCYVPEEPKDYCDTLEGVQAEDEDCPKPEPTCEELQNCPEPPVVEEPKKDKKKGGDGCEKPSKAQGFRFQFQGSGNLLKWEKKGSWDKVDIAVYGMDQKTLLYNIRTEDDGEYLMPTQYTWHKIRGVGSCGLGEWSKLIN